MDHFFVPDHAVPMRELFHTNVAASFGHHLLLGNDVAGGEVGEGCGDVGVKAAFFVHHTKLGWQMWSCARVSCRELGKRG